MEERNETKEVILGHLFENNKIFLLEREILLENLAKFYFFAVLNDTFALELAHQANRMIQKKLSQNSEHSINKMFIDITFQVWERNRRRIHKGRPHFSPDKYFLLDSIDFSHWIEFQKNATDDELLTVIWIKLMNFSEEDLEYVHRISVGTIRYRLGEAMKKLGKSWK